jgi:hypothetical protein
VHWATWALPLYRQYGWGRNCLSGTVAVGGLAPVIETLLGDF